MPGLASSGQSWSQGSAARLRHDSLALTDDPMVWFGGHLVANHQHSMVDFQRRVRGIGRAGGQLAVGSAPEAICNSAHLGAQSDYSLIRQHGEQWMTMLQQCSPLKNSYMLPSGRYMPTITGAICTACEQNRGGGAAQVKVDRCGTTDAAALAAGKCHKQHASTTAEQGNMASISRLTTSHFRQSSSSWCSTSRHSMTSWLAAAHLA